MSTPAPVRPSDHGRTSAPGPGRIPWPCRVWLAGTLVSRWGDAVLYFALGWAGAAHGGTVAGAVLAAVLVATGLAVGVADAFFLPAAGSTVRRLAPPAVLPRVMAITQGGGQLVALAGAPVGAWLVHLAGFGGAAAFDVVTFVVAVVCVVVLRGALGDRPADAAPAPLARAAVQGIGVVARHAVLRPASWFTGAVAAFALPVASLVVPLLGHRAGCRRGRWAWWWVRSRPVRRRWGPRWPGAAHRGPRHAPGPGAGGGGARAEPSLPGAGGAARPPVGRGRRADGAARVRRAARPDGRVRGAIGAAARGAARPSTAGVTWRRPVRPVARAGAARGAALSPVAWRGRGRGRGRRCGASGRRCGARPRC